MSKIGKDVIKQKKGTQSRLSSGRFKESWKENIDYAVRNITTGDEEETRLVEDPNAYIEGWKNEGVSPEDHRQLTKLLRAAVRRSEDGEDYSDLMQDILKILKKYMTHQNLYKRDYGKWEDTFFSREEQGKVRKPSDTKLKQEVKKLGFIWEEGPFQEDIITGGLPEDMRKVKDLIRQYSLFPNEWNVGDTSAFRRRD